MQFARKLKSILEKAGKIGPEEAAELLQESRKGDKSFAELVVQKGHIDDKGLLSLVATAANVVPVDLDKIKPSEDVADTLSAELAREYKVFPLEKIGNMATVAIANPFDVLKLDDLRIHTGCELRPVLSTEEAIDRAINNAYKSDSQQIGEVLEDFNSDGDIELKERSDDEDGMDLSAISDEAAPIVKLVNKIISDACNSGVSDIHIEPFEKRVIIRYRRDGRLVEVMQLPKRAQNNLTSRIKIMSSLDIAEKNKPQDGKFQMRMGNKAIDFRVSILPVVWGEKTVLRILDSSNLAVDIKSLGFEGKCMDDYTWAIERPYGMILVTGPTGSGKSTTLYSAVQHIAQPEINLVTVEDPVEYTIEGINQVPVNPKRGMTFAGALRSILRQDPDVVLLGEIRDAETLEIAIKAALTGHLVLSTLHTNDSVQTITRMVDMGVDPFMVASSAILICAQRLARKLCSHCKEPLDVDRDTLLRLGLTEEDLARDDLQLYKPVGCPRCTMGYKGRFAILETLRMSEPLKRMVVEAASVQDIKKQALAEGMLTLRRCGLLNFMRGTTSIEEVERCTMAD